MKVDLIFKFESNNIWFNEFKNHFKRLDNEIKFKIIDQYISEMKEIDGLYDFSLFWYKTLLKWSGYLDSELVYLTVKSLVLSGMFKEARIVGKGFEYDLACMSWLIGSYFRENKKSSEFNLLWNQFKESNLKQLENDNLAYNDCLAWIMAFTSIEECINIYIENKSKFINSFPLYILLERLISDHRLNECFEYINEHNFYPENNLVFNNLISNKEAVLYQLTGNQDKAIIQFELVIDNAFKIGDKITIAKVNFNLGSSYYYQGNFSQALSLYNKSKTIYELIGDDIGLAKVFNNLSTIYIAQGEYLKAFKYLNLAYNLFIKTNYDYMIIGVSIKLADLERIKGNYSKSLSICKNYFTDKKSILNYEIKYKIASIQEELGEFAEAEKSLEDSIKIAKEVGYEIGVLKSLYGKGKILIKKGQVIEAKKLLDLVFKRNQFIKNERNQINTLELLGYCYLLEGRIIEAEGHTRTALEFARNLKIFMQEISSQNTLAIILYTQGYFEKALNILESIFYLMDSKDIKNSIYLSSLMLKIKIGINCNFSRHNVILDIFELMETAKKCGSLYWFQIGQLLEVEDYIKNYEMDQAEIKLNNITIIPNSNFNLFNLSNILVLKCELIKLEKMNIQMASNADILKDKILECLTNPNVNNSIIYSMEYNILLIELYKIKKEFKLATEVKQLGISICKESGLNYYINKFKKINLTDGTKESQSESGVIVSEDLMTIIHYN